MIVTDKSVQLESVKKVNIRKVFPGGESNEENYTVVSEHTLQIILDNDDTIETVCTPENLLELVVGRLFTENLIASRDDIVQIIMNSDGSRADVTLTHTFAQFPEYQVLPDHSFCIQDVFAAAELFSEGSSIHRRTSGTHSCYLIGKNGKVFFSREDISRHNALDKVLGNALLNDIRLSDKAIYTSGRVPLDMMQKVIHAGVPVLISKSVPTLQSMLMAEQYGLTLVTSAWPDNIRLVAGHL